jgi:phosphatidylinositol-bisphosphatase
LTLLLSSDCLTLYTDVTLRSVLILKCKSGASIEDLSVEVAYPIAGDFSFSVAQARRTTLDLRASAGESAAALNQSRSGA